MNAAAAPALAGLPADADDAAWREAARQFLAADEQAHADAFDARASQGEQDSLPIDELLAARAAAVDAVVADAWRRCFGTDARFALVATGGYGRGELFPRSDVDLLVLAAAEAQQERQADIERFFALLWDASLAPGHAVRSIEQCVEAAREDVTVATALLESRLLVGDAAAYAGLRAALAPPEVWPAHAYFAAKRAEQEQRHARYHDTAYNLEPNLKDGPGGLRDLHTLLWMVKRIYSAGTLAELLALGALGSDELETLERERRVLSRLRYALHLVAGRREERLLFDYQIQLARRFGLQDRHRENLAVEQLMQGFFRSAAMVLRLNARLLQRFEEELAGEPVHCRIDDDFELRGDYLAITDPRLFARRPEAMLELFSIWQQHTAVRGLHSETARALGESLPLIDERLRGSGRVRALFMDMLRHPRAVESLGRMAGLGVLGRYLPPFGRVSGRMQYDLFHVYTVDQHTLAVLRNIASFASPDSGARFGLAHGIWQRLRKPELLLLAGLFHDIAKGRGGDHSELGEEDARAFCTDHGLSQGDTELVAWLVRQHLVMSTTAQRQDISDPDVVQRFAALVGERERLDYLYLLTIADIAGTSPKLWNAWKDRLLGDLYNAARFALRQGFEQREYTEERIAETRAAARALLQADAGGADGGIGEAQVARVWETFPDESFLRYRPEQLAWQTRGIAAHRTAHPDLQVPLVLARPHARPGALEVFVYSPDRDGLFAAVTATLDRLGLGVVEARVVGSRDGMSLDTFQVLDAGTEFVSPERRAATVAGALARVLATAPYSVAPARRAVPRQLRHFRVPARIQFDDDPASGRTRMMLVCTDRPGLLAQVAAVLRAHRLRVHDARIATFGERVEDFFQLTDEDDRPLPPDRLEELRAALVACVDSAYGSSAYGDAPGNGNGNGNGNP